MCEFISDTHLMPGYVCCRCRTYNGLQRKQCRACQQTRHDVELPPSTFQCIYCEFAYEEGQRGSLGGNCPVCGGELPVVAPTMQGA